MKNKFTLPALFLVFLILAAGIIAAGFLYYRSQQVAYKTEIEYKLAAVARLKTDEISRWREERFGDAGVFHENKTFSALVERYIERPEESAPQEELRSWISRVQVGHHYDRVALLDAMGNERMSAPDTNEPIGSAVRQKVPEALRSGQVTFVDFYRDDSRKIRLALLIPILDGKDGGPPLGVVVLRMDPNTYLYPFIQDWPTPSKTPETLLIRREGNEVVFLNELKFQKDTALTLRIPLESRDVPAVKAALGEEGIVEGIDYRGVPVVAAVRAVPDSPWFLVARMDAAEVDAPMRGRLWLTVLLLGVLLFAAAASVGLVWRDRSARFNRQRAEAAETLRESETRLRLAVESSNIGLWDWDLRANTVYFSPEWKRQIGYRDDEISNRFDEWESRVHPDDLESTMQKVRAFTDDPRSRYEVEFRFRHKDGSYRWIYAQADMLRDAAGNPSHMLGCHIDITNRKQAEKALGDSEVKYRRLFEAAKDGILILDAETGMVRDVNPFLVEILGYSHEQLLGKRIWDLGFFKDVAANQANFVTLQQQEYVRYEHLPLETSDGRQMDVEFVSNIYLVGQRKVIQCNIRDITERRLADSERELTIKVLRLIGQANERRELLGLVADLVRSWSGCDAVGIRLCEGEDFPYFETREFPPDFVLAENCLCAVDSRGELKRDSEGNPVLECMCGNIICGRFDPSKPFFTADGSFWTNSTTELLANTTEADRHARTRNRCNGEGFESVALIPLRAAGETLGLLQVNDRRKGQFTPRRIALLERLADSLALALAHQNAQRSLRDLLREKESLLKEVHHRVKNNLQVISSLVRLQSAQVENGLVQAALLDMQNRIGSMALLHETLYQSENFAQIDLATYLRTLCSQLFHSLVAAPESIQLRLDVASVDLDVTQAVPCGLLVNELVSNCLKHAFPGGRAGEVRVELQPVDGGPAVRLRVADNGVGLPADFDLPQLRSLGLQLVSDLVGQLQGRLEIGGGPGAAFEVVFTPQTANPDGGVA